MNHGHGVAPLQVMRVLWCAGVALCIACASAPAIAQDDLDRCAAPLMLEAPAIADPATFWNEDREVSVWRRKDGDRYAYRIVGDIVELTPKLFSALATAPGQPLRDVSEISVDAREVVLAMPIRLLNGSVKLTADTVRVTGDGSISVIDPPAQRDQAVAIVTNTLDLVRAPDMPFMFPTQGWILNAQPNWPAAGSSKRLLRVKARKVVPPPDASERSQQQLKDDPLRWFHNKTADQGFDSGLPKALWSAGYDIAIGDAAGSIYDAMYGTTLLWPDLAVAKLSRLHARAPFDPAVNVFVNAKIDELMPRLSQRASQQAAATLRLMREQMALGIDPLGFRQNEVAMTGLPDRLKAFQKSLDDAFGRDKKAGSIELWDKARLAALAAGQVTDTARQVDQIDRMLRVENSARTAAAQRISGDTDKLLKMIEDGQARIAEAATINDQLLAQYTAEKEQALTFGRIVDDLIVNETTIGIGRPAAAPYALGWTPGATAPASYYGSKDGTQPSGAPNDLHEIAGRYQSYATLIGDFSAAWKAVDPHLAPALGHLTGKQKNEAELAGFTGAMADVFAKSEALRAGLVRGPAEFTLGLNDYTPMGIDQQKKWTTLLKEAEAMTATAGNLQAAILADVERVRAVDAEIQWLGAVRTDLLALKSLPKEDAVQHQAFLIGQVRSRLLATVASSAEMLRRGFFYVTGENTGAPNEALDPTDALAAQGLDPRHPELYDPAQMQVALEADRAALSQYYEGLAGKLTEVAGAFVDKNPAVPPSAEFFRAAYEDDVSHDLEASYLRARFLDSVNRSIAEQIALGRSGAGFAERPILVPITIAPAGLTSGAQFLLGVAVTKAHFQGEPRMPAGITFRIEHPRWGTVMIDGICRRVIDAPDNPAGIETGFSTDISLTRDVHENWAEAVPTDHPFARILDNAFPINAPYYAYVDVSSPGAWTQVPVIDEIQILFIKTGTKLQ